MKGNTRTGNRDYLSKPKKISKLPKHVINDGAKWLMLLSKIILNSLSVWPENQNIARQILNFLSIISHLLVIWGHIYYLTTENPDLGSIAYVICILIVTIEAMTRRLLCHFYKERLTKILAKVYFEFWPSTVVGNDLHTEVTQGSWYLLIYCTIYTSSAWLCAVQYLMVPFFNGNSPLRTAYPFPWRESPYYELVYVWQSFLSIELASTICGLDILFLTLLSNCVAQFKLLRSFFSMHFENAVRKAEAGSVDDKKEMMKVVLVCIEHHNKLIHVCKEIEEIFTYFILVQYLASMGTVCLSAFLATAVPEEIGTAASYLIGHICEIFIYCYMGNEIVIESSELSNTVFRCGWHLSSYDKVLQKSLMMIMIRSQKPIRISVGGFGFLSLEGFLKIIQFSFSVYTLLNSIIKKQDDL